MRIEIRGIEIPLAAESRAAIEERTRLLLGRVALRVADVRVIVRDVNGPRKGIDRVCSVDVRLTRGGEVHAEATDGVIRSAVEAALDRASRATLRLVRRQREFRRETPRHVSAETGIRT
jgi:putative sigma-54 modulation protein